MFRVKAFLDYLDDFFSEGSGRQLQEGVWLILKRSIARVSALPWGLLAVNLLTLKIILRRGPPKSLLQGIHFFYFLLGPLKASVSIFRGPFDIWGLLATYLQSDLQVYLGI